jgi:two-component system, sensor histidine kinase and response regulator
LIFRVRTGLRYTVLVADDEEMNRELAQMVLGSEGYDVVFAHNGQEAIMALKRQKVDAVLMDVMMPVMDGFEATRYIKSDERYCDIPLIIVTAANDKESLKTGLSAGANEFLTKPYDIEELKLRIKNMLRLKQKTDALKDMNSALDSMNGELETMNRTLEDMVEKEVAKRMKLEAEKEQQLSALIQQTKMAELGAMMGVITHQWMQPLTIISLNAQMLPVDMGGDEPSVDVANRYSQDILEQTTFMTQTINDFRNFYKPSKQKAPFFVLKQASAIVTLLSTQLSQANITVQIRGDEELCCLGYENEFKQVALNIINNARDAFEERDIQNRLVTIEAGIKNEWIYLTIADNAGGIPTHLLSSIFDSFVSTKGEKGTGIGLSLGKTIIEENMQGKFSVQNIDGGAKFIIELPLGL